MLSEFVDFVEGVFPSLDPYDAAQVKQTIRQHDYNPTQLYEQQPLPEITQADVFRPFPAVVRYGLGVEEITEYDGPALLLSNSCDVENDDHVVYCVGFPYRLFDDDEEIDNETLTANEYFNLFYLPRVPGEGDIVFDLSQSYSLPREIVTDDEYNDHLEKVASLSQLGYYLFISKLTVHFLRPESEEVEREDRLEELGIN